MVYRVNNGTVRLLTTGRRNPLVFDLRWAIYVLCIREATYTPKPPAPEPTRRAKLLERISEHG